MIFINFIGYIIHVFSIKKFDIEEKEYKCLMHKKVFQNLLSFIALSFA